MGYRSSKIFFRKKAIRYNMLKEKSFTPARWSEISHLEMEATEILQRYESDDFYVRPENLKSFIKYILAFRSGHSESSRRLFDKLQSQADFDVNAYVESCLTPFSDKCLAFLGIKNDRYLSSGQMKKRYKTYRKICRECNQGSVSGSRYQTMENLRDEAFDYAEAVDKGEINLKPEDYFEFLNYVSVICYPLQEGTHEHNALKKVTALLKDKQKQDEAQKAQILATKQEKKQKLSLGEKFGLWKKRAYTKLNNVVKTVKESTKSFFENHRKVFKSGLISLAFLGGVFGIVKSCNSSQQTASNPQFSMEYSQAPQRVSTPDTLLLGDKYSLSQNDSIKEVQPFSFVHADGEKKQVETEKSKADSVALHERKIWNNYYDNAVEMFSSANKKQEIYAQIESQLKKGVFSLNDSISKERVAYAYLIYKEYGVPSSIEKVLHSDKKLSTAEQSKFITDIINTGKKGEGVQKIAAEKYKGKLSSFSRYNKSSKRLQQKHIENLKQLKNLKKMNCIQK